MSAFIVSGGSLLEVGCPSTLDRATDQSPRFSNTLGGKRKAFIRKGGRRSWSIDVTVARPAEVSTIETAARMMGPVGWYGPEAVKGNLLSPQASGFDVTPDNATDAGLVQLPDGSIARTVAHTGTASVTPGDAHGGYEAVPVRPGQQVTVGAWALNGLRLLGFWRDAMFQPLSNWNTPTQTFTGWQWFESTLIPPNGAVYLTLSLMSGSQYARPSVAWGTQGRDELGTGCPKAIIHSPRHSPVALWDGANYTDSSYSVTEIG